MLFRSSPVHHKKLSQQLYVLLSCSVGGKARRRKMEMIIVQKRAEWKGMEGEGKRGRGRNVRKGKECEEGKGM